MKVVTDNKHYNDIAEAIREKTATENTYKPEEMASGVNDVYEAGKQKEWSDFWDIMQENGNRTDYNSAFCSRGFTETNFKPKYNINVIAGERMFYQFSLLREAFDLEEHLKKLGVTLDFSNNEKFYMCFTSAYITRLGIIDFSKATKYDNNNAFQNSLIATIDKLIFSENTKLTNLFSGATTLKNIKEVGGVIGTSISFSPCPLTVASLKSVITHLKDYSGTDSEYTYTVTFKTSAFNALEAEGATAEYNGVACTWAELIGFKKWNLVKA